MTAFKRISFPTCDKNFLLQAFILVHTLPLIPLKALSFERPIRAGSPKYFSYHCVKGTPAAVRMFVRSSNGVFLLKKIEVLSLFNFCPQDLFIDG
jgi:hypothetical protein